MKAPVGNEATQVFVCSRALQTLEWALVRVRAGMLLECLGIEESLAAHLTDERPDTCVHLHVVFEGVRVSISFAA